MMFPSSRVRVLVSTQPVDFRKGHDGLAAIVSSVLRKDPFTGTVFVFRYRPRPASPMCPLSADLALSNRLPGNGSANMPTTCHYTAKARSWRAQVLICTAPCWRIGLETRRSI